MTRQEHLEWCKERALEYVKQGDITQAYTSMASNLGKHPETAKHAGIALGMALLMFGNLDTSDKMQRFIEGFN
ncbi:hypothetical protein LCGC14_1081290 [marine sediment metagenome]|uniref:Uncharacterized protein n=1 Tax=marine sediment metagenome TaxID=412755 RepID=A0A0F9PYD0_9ZZZZ